MSKVKLHSRILSKLADTLSKLDNDINKDDLQRFSSKCPLLPKSNFPIDSNTILTRTDMNSVNVIKMTKRNAEALSAFIKYTLSISQPPTIEIMMKIMNYVRCLQVYEWEFQLNSEVPALPETVTYQLFYCLIYLSRKIPEQYPNIVNLLVSYTESLYDQFSDIDMDVDHTICFLFPSLLGVFGALQNSPYFNTEIQLDRFNFHIRSMTKQQTMENIKNAITTCINRNDINNNTDDNNNGIMNESASTSRLLLKIYWENDVPLTPNRIIYDSLVVIRNILARIAVNEDTNFNNHCLDFNDWFCYGKFRKKSHLTCNIERIWTELMKNTANIKLSVPLSSSKINNSCDLNNSNENENVIDEERNRKNMRALYVSSVGYYHDVRDNLKMMEINGIEDRSETFYLTGIMGISLHVAALASVSLQEVDDILVTHIIDCLFIDTKIYDSWIHVAALDAAVLLAINFKHLNNRMIDTICQFLATPSSTFENNLELENITMCIRKFAIIRLSQCIQIMPKNDVSHTAMSVLYRLLNELIRYNESSDAYEKVCNHSDLYEKYRARDFDEEQKKQVQKNVLSAIIDVAAYLKDDNIISQAFSMLILQRKSFSISTIKFYISSLVELASACTINIFEEILTLLSEYSIEYFSSDNNQVWLIILNAQIDLSKQISCRPEFYQTYLTKLLSLFLEHGNKLLTVESKINANMLEKKLGSFLQVIYELLVHDDFNPQDNPPTETLTILYQNMWFFLVLFDFVVETKETRYLQPLLLVIAQKTPLLIIDGASEYLESNLEHNFVLNSENAVVKRKADYLKQKLTDLLPSHAYDIKYLPFPLIVFLLAIYYTETRRSQTGGINFMVRYFMNENIDTELYLTRCLEGISDLVVNDYINVSSIKANNQLLGQDINKQLERLLSLCCHKTLKVHQLSIKMVDSIVCVFPQVFAEKSLITLLLELVQLVWLSCNAEYMNEYNAVYQFSSNRINASIEMVDCFDYRKKVFNKIQEYAKKWLKLSMNCCPMETTGSLQDYISESEFDVVTDSTHIGRIIAIEVGKISSSEQSLGYHCDISGVHFDNSSSFTKGFTSRRYYMGEINGVNFITNSQNPRDETNFSLVKALTDHLLVNVKKNKSIEAIKVHQSLYRTAAYIISQKKVDSDLINNIVRLPVYIFTEESLCDGTDVWNWIIIERPDLEKKIMVEILNMWFWAQSHRKGLFSPKYNLHEPFLEKMTYTPSNTSNSTAKQKVISKLFSPHEIWLRFITSHFFSIRHRNRHVVKLCIRLLKASFQNTHLMSTHSMSRLSRFQLLYLGIHILKSVHLEAYSEYKLRSLVYGSAYSWFELPPLWRYGSWKSMALLEKNITIKLFNLIKDDNPKLDHIISSNTILNTNSSISSGLYMLSKDKTKDDAVRDHELSKKLLLLLLENEIYRISVWMNPLNEASNSSIMETFVCNIEKSLNTDDSWKTLIRFAWKKNPRMAIQLLKRFNEPIVNTELHNLIANNTLDVVDVPDALAILLGSGIQPNAKLDLKYLKYWAPVPAITAANYFLPAYGNKPIILQYAMRSLEYYSVDIVFFYIPQIVQALRHDEFGYVKNYILKAGQVSQLFAHQIIWNMKANFYIDADKDCEKADTLKPTLENIIEELVVSFDGADREFYEREFKFFGEVTAISGYLKEYIKYGQVEKKPLQKKRLDEELSKIKVDVGVYLPSNPDGHVVDISRTSGRPLQSHAKAPFMATFLVEKNKKHDNYEEIEDIEKSMEQLKKSKKVDNEYNEDNDINATVSRIWQSAIFKVGDDCRQDVLALQLIAVFKNIFSNIGLDLYLYPYRVVATAPGRGVIDVIPQSISRDQLGREKVNSLYDYFVVKYGHPNTIKFQKAKNNFVKSLAAYSVVSYLLQIKDRHNGNIMLNETGHLIHIDFGFIFDIAPGGITFESSPFKLTTEMIQVMGGSSEEQSFKQFSDLVVKAYLATRPHAEQIMQLVTLMLESGLPCFKGDTIKRMRSRFQTDKSERVAADYIIQRIRDSFENQRTVLYDYFQKVTNGIPY
ncbi:unnamed protein product [Cunninghamella blakesleeana]